MFSQSKPNNSNRISRHIFIYLCCYCSTTLSFILQKTSATISFPNDFNINSNNHLRHRRSALLTNPIFLQDWPKLDFVKVKSDEVVIGCFQELGKNFLNHRITLNAEKFSRKFGCPLRVPAHSNFRIVKTNVNEELSFFQIFSGPSRSDLQQTSGKIRDADGYTFGPFEDDYVLFLFKPTVSTDYITFNLESSTD